LQPHERRFTRGQHRETFVEPARHRAAADRVFERDVGQLVPEHFAQLVLRVRVHGFDRE
jgi:hypothetical protein